MLILFWTLYVAEKIKELESTIGELEEQLQEQEEDAQTCIEQWEQSYKQLEETNAELSRSLEEAERSQQTLPTLQIPLDEAKDALAAATVTTAKAREAAVGDGE